MPYFKQQKLYIAGLGPCVELWMSTWRNWNLLFITLQTSADYMAKTGSFAGGTLQSWDSTGLSKLSPVALFRWIFFMLSWHCAPILPERTAFGSEKCCVHSAHGFLKRQQTSLTIVSESTVRPQTSNPPSPKGLVGFAWEQMGFNRVLARLFRKQRLHPASVAARCNIWRRKKAEVPHFHFGHIQKNLEDLHNSSGWR